MGRLFLQILNMGVMAGYCVCVILVLRLFLRKLPKIYSYVLWSVVYFRLVCPVSFHSVLSLVRVDPQLIPDKMIAWEAAGRGSGVVQGERVAESLPRASESLTGMDSGISELSGVLPQASEALTGMSGPAPGMAGVSDAASEMTGSQAGMSVIQMIFVAGGWIWVAVAAGLILYHIWSVWRLKQQLVTATQYGDGERVYEAENLQTPFVLGVFRPNIYLPASLLERERRYVLAHERTHIRRKDYLLKQAAFLVTCVYWFHPLVWLAFYLMCRDMEMSCDESVIRELGGREKKDYSASLLALASGRQILAGSPPAFGEGGIRARITNVMDYHRPGYKVRVSFGVLLAFVLAGLASNPGVRAEYRYGELPAEVTEILLARGDASVQKADGTQLWIELWLTEGVYYDEEHGLPGVGTYAENYAGSYELRTVDEAGETVCSASLAKLWGEDGRDTFNFPGEFELKCADYNGDGCLDFTVGQAGSSSVNLFMLFTIREDGSIGRLCDSAIPAEETDAFSVVFRHEQESERKPLVTYLWSNVTSDTQILLYRWNAETGRYEQEGSADSGAEEGDADSMGQWEPGMSGAEYERQKETDASGAAQKWSEETDVSGAEQEWSEETDVSGAAQEWQWKPGMAEVEVMPTENGAAAGRAAAGKNAARAGENSAVLPDPGNHREGFKEPVLHLHVPEDTLATGFVDLDGMPEEEYSVYAVQALRELYDLTGTQVEECYYFYYNNGGYIFAMTEEDLDNGRDFYMRWYGETVDERFYGIESMYIAYARRVWYSPVYQCDLPEDFDTYEESEQAVWFVTHSALYNGQKVAQCIQPYDSYYMPHTWRVIMEDDTAYELTLDAQIDSVSDITGPYPDSNINH